MNFFYKFCLALIGAFLLFYNVNAKILTIQGHVLSESGNVIPNDWVIISGNDFNYKIHFYDEVLTDSKGFYSCTLQLPDTVISGLDIYVDCYDCTFNLVEKDFIYNNQELLIADFIICDASPLSYCYAVYDFINDSTGLVYTFSERSQGFNITSWSWNFGDSNTSTIRNPVHQFSKEGKYNVCLTILWTAGDSIICTNTFCWEINVVNSLLNCSANFSYDIDNTGLGCYFSPFDQPEHVTSWLWNFGDGQTSNLPEPYHLYKLYIQDSVCLTITTFSGCKSTLCLPITLTPDCNAAFSYTADSIYKYHFIYNNYGKFNTLLWDFGDSTTSNKSNPNHTFNTTGFHDVCLTLTDKDSLGNIICSDRSCQSIGIGTPSNQDMYCDVDFRINQISTYAFRFYDLSYANMDNIDKIISWSWNFGDSTSSDQQFPPMHTFAKGLYNVSLTINTLEGCSSFLSQQLIVDSNKFIDCHSDFEVYLDYSQPFTYFFQESSFTEDSVQVITNDSWNFGDGTNSILSNPKHTFPLGVYHICHTITTSTGCKSTYCENIVVDSACYLFARADSIINESSAGAKNGAIYLNVVGTPPFKFKWNNGDNTQDISGLNAGYYNVIITDSIGCQTWATFEIQDQSVVSNWNPKDSLVTTPVIKCFNFQPANAIIYNYTFNKNKTVSITWIVFNSSFTLHDYVTNTYSYDSTGYFKVLLTVTCSKGKNLTNYKFYDFLYIYNFGDGINEINNSYNYISLFPNPAKDNITVFTRQKSNMDILNIQGQLIKTIPANNFKTTIDISEFVQGMYFLRIITEKGIAVKKFVKE